jgi:hypothetical protein
MKRTINYPLFPVTAYPGDGENPPVKSNSGMGVREFCSLVVLHALLTNPKCNPTEAVEEAIATADQLIERLSSK